MHHWWNADPSQCGRWDGAPSPTLKNRIAGWFHSLTLGTRPGKLKAGSWRDACTSMLIAECFKTAKRWRWTKCPSADEQMNKTWYIHTMQYYSTSREKEVLTHAAAWMNFWGRCAKGQKPATKKKKKKNTDSSSMKHLEYLSFIETESRMVVPRAGAGGSGGTWSIGAEFHFCEMKRVLWMDWGDDNKAMWLYLMPVNWTQKWLWWWFLYYMYFTKIKKKNTSTAITIISKLTKRQI